MPTPRQVLDLLSRDELLALADEHQVIVGDRRVKAHIAEQLDTKGPALGEMIAGLPRDRLAELCRTLGLDDSGKAKQPLIERLAGTGTMAPAEAATAGSVAPAAPAPASTSRPSPAVPEP